MTQMEWITAEDTYALRKKVMWPDLALQDQGIEGDDTAIHLGAYLDGMLVGVGSLFPDGPGVFRLRKLAVDQDMQGRGIGRDILVFAQDSLRAQGARLLWCDARLTAVPFYTRCGFTCDDVVFVKRGLDYVKARVSLV